MAKGWYGNSLRHMMSKKRIKTKKQSKEFIKNVEIKRIKMVDIFDIIKYFNSNNHKKEISLTTDELGYVLDYNVGTHENVDFFITDYINAQKTYHSHPTNARPSLTDIHIFLKIPNLQESWVITPDFVYSMTSKNMNNEYKDLSFKEFEEKFYKKVSKDYGKEFVEKYKKLEPDEQSIIFEEFTSKYLIPDSFIINKYEILENNTLKRIKEID